MLQFDLCFAIFVKNRYICKDIERTYHEFSEKVTIINDQLPMSYLYGFDLSCREADFPRVRNFAIEETRKQSLKDLGYDLTDPKLGHGVANSFFVSEEQHALCWGEHSGARKSLDVDGIMDRIVQRFPEVEFIYSQDYDGFVDYEEYRKGSEREEVNSFALDVAVKDEAVFQVLSREAQAFVEEQETLLDAPLFEEGSIHPPFVVFPMNRVRVSIKKKTVGDLIKHLWDVVRTPLYCVFVEDWEDSAGCARKAVFSGGELSWERIDYHFVMLHGNTPDGRVLDFLFSSEEGVMGEDDWFYFDSETGIRTSIYPEKESDGLEKTSEKDDEGTDWHDLPWE